MQIGTTFRLNGAGYGQMIMTVTDTNETEITATAEKHDKLTISKLAIECYAKSGALKIVSVPLRNTEPTAEQIYSEIARHYTVEYSTCLDGKQYYSVIKSNLHSYRVSFRFLNFSYCNRGFALRGASCQCPRFHSEEKCHHVYLAVVEHCKRIGLDKETSDSLEIAFTKIKNILGEHNPKTFSVETLEAIEAVNQIRHELFEAKRLIEKFSDKHQPKLSRWK